MTGILDVIAQDAGVQEAGLEVRDKELKLISTLARKLVKLKAQHLDLVTQTKTLEAAIRKLEEEDLPNAMTEAGVRGFTLPDGSRVEVSSEVYPSVTQDNMKDAVEWLKAHGHGALVKCEVKVMFGKDEVKLADKLQTQLLKEQRRFTAKVFIHPQTLKKFVRESLAEGQELPECFTVHSVNKARVELPKVQTEGVEV